MDLQRFVTEVIEAAGGIVVPLEYALCHVIMPDEYKELFNGRNEFILAFDFEVYQENDTSDFVTFGSFILDRILELAGKKALCTIRFGIVDRLALSKPLDKIKNSLELPLHANVSVLSERPVLCLWTAFNFRVTYISDEHSEEIMEIWVDGITGKVSESITAEKSSVFYQTNPAYDFPLAKLPDIPNAFKKAYAHAQKNAQLKVRENTRKDELEKELRRIDGYYKDLEDENIKRMSRKGITEEHRQELENKIKTLQLEKERQMKEIKEKYTIKPHIALDNGIVYAIPGIEYIISVVNRNEKYEKYVYYDPVLREIR